MLAIYRYIRLGVLEVAVFVNESFQTDLEVDTRSIVLRIQWVGIDFLNIMILILFFFVFFL